MLLHLSKAAPCEFSLCYGLTKPHQLLLYVLPLQHVTFYVYTCIQANAGWPSGLASVREFDRSLSVRALTKITDMKVRRCMRLLEA